MFRCSEGFYGARESVTVRAVDSFAATHLLAVVEPFPPAAGDEPFSRLGGYRRVPIGGRGAFLRALGTTDRPAARLWEGTLAHFAPHRSRDVRERTATR